MKHTNWIYIACLALLTAGCHDNDYGDIDHSGKTKFIEATTPVFIPSSRASDGDVTNTIYWDNSDQVAVNSLKSSRTRVDAYDPTKAEFAFNVALPTPYCAVFPYSAYSSFDRNTSSGTVKIPDSQRCKEGTFDSDASLMLAYSEEEGSMQFQHALAWIRLSVNKTSTSANIRKITLSDDSGAAMSGLFKATFSSDGCAVSTSNKDGSAVTINCQGEGLELGQNVLIAIPARAYHGLTFSIVDENADFMKMDMKNLSFTASPGMVYPVSIDFEPGAFFGEISSELDWNSFAAKAAKGYSFQGDTVRLLADIVADDLDMVTGTFKGTFLGGGHTITQNQNSRPLFETVGEEAKVTQLNVAGRFGTLGNPSQYGNAAIAMLNLGTIENVEVNCPLQTTVSSDLVLGGIAAQNGGTIKDCVNKGDAIVTVHAGKTILTCIGGGIAAYGNEIAGTGPKNGVPYAGTKAHAGRFVNCSNRGAVQVSVTGDGVGVSSSSGSVAGLSCFGGICGMVMCDNAVFDHCNNYAAVSRTSVSESSCAGASAIGGILGSCTGLFNDWTDRGATLCYNTDTGYQLTLDQCNNEGRLTSKSRHSGCVDNARSGARVDYVGGIAGLSIGGNESRKAVIRKCTNTGTVSGGWSKDVNTVVLGGIAGGASWCDITGCTVTGTIEAIKGTAVGASGGWVAFAKKQVSVNGGSKAFVKYNLPQPNANLPLLWGLGIGNVTGSALINDASLGGSGLAEHSLAVDESNFSKYIYNASTKVRPQIKNVTYWNGN